MDEATEAADLKNILEVAAKVLLRCFIMNFGLILFWFFFFLLGSSQWGYEFHSKLFDISRHEFELINYCGMAFVKLCNFVFFLFPYAAIRLVLQQNNFRK